VDVPPVLRHAEELPGPQRAALLGAFRQVDEAVNDPVEWRSPR